MIEYKNMSKEYQLAVKKYNFEYEKKSAKTQIQKSFIAMWNLNLS